MATPSQFFLVNKIIFFKIKIELAIEWETHEPKCRVHTNIFCTYGHFNEARLISREMEWKTVRKEPGLSWIEVGNQLHEFVSEGQQHPEREAICARLE